MSQKEKLRYLKRGYFKRELSLNMSLSICGNILSLKGKHICTYMRALYKSFPALKPLFPGYTYIWCKISEYPIAEPVESQVLLMGNSFDLTVFFKILD